jgi:hypothetical protein
VPASVLGCQRQVHHSPPRIIGRRVHLAIVPARSARSLPYTAF